MTLPYYQIRLPMPPSVNAMHTVGRGFRNKNTGKWQEKIVRSAEYKNWIQFAAVQYRNAFPGGVQKLNGRLAAYYAFFWNENDRGRDSSDIANREKCLSDFLEHKFFKNDNQIDEQHQYRRFVSGIESGVLVRVYQIPDRRYDPVNDIFN